MGYDLFRSFAHPSSDYIIPDADVVDIPEKLFNSGLGAIEMVSYILCFDRLCEIVFDVLESTYEKLKIFHALILSAIS